MTWYHSYDAVVGVTVYHFDGETQKHFNRMHPQFLIVPCNVHFGLCTDKFNPFKSFTASYSYRLVILTVYNLSRRMCMRLKFMFLSTVIPGPNSLSRNIDDYLQPLIDELKQLWSSRTLTCDVSRKQNFQMKTTLMWTINDFSAYEMVFGWSTHEKFACSYHSFEIRPGQVIGSRVRWVDPGQPKKKKTADNYSIK